jgi:hypothetical protein
MAHGVEEQTPDAYTNGAIGDIKRRPVVMGDVHINEIDHLPEP